MGYYFLLLLISIKILLRIPFFYNYELERNSIFSSLLEYIDSLLFLVIYLCSGFWNATFQLQATFKYLLKIAEIFSVVLALNWCVLITCWNVFHFESIFIGIIIVRFKLNHHIFAWWCVAGWNWSTTILSHYEWCTWTTIKNGQVITAKKIIF